MTRRALLFFFASFFAGAATVLAQGNPDWHTAFPAFKIAGNLYYVGTADLAVYLINTPQGNILINSDFEQDLPLIKKSIEQLGFKYSDTKIILISHAHGDHDAATGLIKKETGASLMVMDADVPEEQCTARGRPGAHVDRVLHDGDTVELGVAVEPVLVPTTRRYPDRPVGRRDPGAGRRRHRDRTRGRVDDLVRVVAVAVNPRSRR